MEAERVVCNERTYTLCPEILWHAAPAQRTLIYHNVFLGEGRLATQSVLARDVDENIIASPYGFRAKTDPKELIWEAERRKIGDHLPSRIGALFLVQDRAVAEEITRKWFPDRNILRVQVTAGSKVWLADTKLHDCQPAEWSVNARRYWTGQTTGEPEFEVLVDGTVYFPDWRAKPFGMGAGWL